MGRYYFNLFNDHETIDEEGIELADDDAAREWARREIQYQAGESVKMHGHLVLSHHMVIYDAGASQIDTITFGDVIAVRD